MKARNEKNRKAEIGKAADRLRAANHKIRAIRDEAEKFIIDGKAKLAEYERQTAQAVREANAAQREMNELASGIRWNPNTAQFEEC